MRTLPLNPQTNIPILGFGTWQLTGWQARRAVLKALEIGYRHIDTAKIYGNQKQLKRAILESGIPRSELFITSKVWWSSLAYHKVIAECDKTLKELGTDYLDLYLIHWPNRRVPLADTLRALKELHGNGKIKAIGVSNFTINHLKDALATGVPITNNQIEFHPFLQQNDLVAFCKEHGITVTAYCPLARGKACNEETIKKIARAYNRTPAHVVLKWIMEKDLIAIPKSGNPARIEENFATLTGEWRLSAEDAARINALDKGKRLVNPFHAEFGY